MRTRSKFILTGLTATLLMGLAVNSATAGRLSTSNRNFRLVWRALHFEGEEVAAALDCPVTLEGSFHSATIRKQTGLLAGAVSRGIVKNESCTGGRATIVQNSLPWHVTYEGFVGTLPNITDLVSLLSRYAFQTEVTVIFIRVICLYRDAGNAEENLAGIVARNTAGGALTTLFPLAGRHARRFSGSGSCPNFGTFEGAAEVFILGNTTRFSVTLI